MKKNNDAGGVLLLALLIIIIPLYLFYIFAKFVLHLISIKRTKTKSKSNEITMDEVINTEELLEDWCRWNMILSEKIYYIT